MIEFDVEVESLKRISGPILSRPVDFFPNGAGFSLREYENLGVQAVLINFIMDSNRCDVFPGSKA